MGGGIGVLARIWELHVRHCDYHSSAQLVVWEVDGGDRRRKRFTILCLAAESRHLVWFGAGEGAYFCQEMRQRPVSRPEFAIDKIHGTYYRCGTIIIIIIIHVASGRRAKGVETSIPYYRTARSIIGTIFLFASARETESFIFLKTRIYRHFSSNWPNE